MKYPIRQFSIFYQRSKAFYVWKNMIQLKNSHLLSFGFQTNKPFFIISIFKDAGFIKARQNQAEGGKGGQNF